jgi:site-specific recombinase XerC
VQRVSELHKYTRELGRLKEYCEQEGVYTVQRVTRELLTGFMATWETTLRLSPVTQSKTRERLRSFLRYCYEAEWLPRIPVLPTVKADMLPTMPLTAEEYDRLLASIPLALPNHPEETRQKVHALFQLMRWSDASSGGANPPQGCLSRRDPKNQDRHRCECYYSAQRSTGSSRCPEPQLGLHLLVG